MNINQVNCPQGSIAYTIRAGDTLYSLAIRYGTTVSAIMRINPNINPNALQIGQVICIPVQGPPAGCPPGSTSYTIRAGDTFYSLAIRFNTTVQALINANPGVNPNALRIGQVICIPGAMPPPGTCPPGTRPYTIRAGDTFYNIAIRFNTTVQALINANPGVNPNALRIGQVICVPGTTPPPGTCGAGTFAYTVRAGDTLFSLANRYNTTVSAIVAANPNVDLSILRVGQIICIPGTPQGTCPPNTMPYTIRSGDTFFSLAQRFGTTVAAIQAANPGVNPNRLQIGQIICIPR